MRSVSRQFVARNIHDLWMTDMTYIPTSASFIYLSVVLDVYSRKVVSWALGEHMTTKLVVTVLNMALQSRKPGSVTHRSAHYTSMAFGKRCHEFGIRSSMGTVGDF